MFVLTSKFKNYEKQLSSESLTNKSSPKKLSVFQAAFSEMVSKDFCLVCNVTLGCLLVDTYVPGREFNKNIFKNFRVVYFLRKSSHTAYNQMKITVTAVKLITI